MRLTYLCPDDDSPSGGVKVIYRHAGLLAENGVEAYVFHPNDPKFRCDWFAHSAKVRADPRFIPDEDFIVVPEVGAHPFGETCIRGGLRYAILVQGGYLIGQNVGPDRDDVLRGIYEGASLVASISEDTTATILFAYPRISADRIVRLLPGIGEPFRAGHKQKIITYMPRKLPMHAERLCFFLRQHLPPGWRLAAIRDRSESEVATMLGESAVFMSLCDQEGFGLPPLEAALSGNIVVGYTGQGAREYFQEPVFREVANGDYRCFVRSVLRALEDVERGVPQSSAYLRQIEDLRQRYSLRNEVAHLLQFAKRAEEVLVQARDRVSTEKGAGRAKE